MTEWRFDLGEAPAPGSVARGNIAWGDRLLEGWDFPYVAVHGARPGPAVVITAGYHGSEYPSIDAVVRLGATLDPASVSGQVLCLPLMNPAAFWERMAYLTPIDGLNLNRVFPGRPQGSFSERVAYHLFARAIGRADAYIDLHGGDLPESLLPFAAYFESGEPDVDTRGRAMAEAFGLPHVVAQSDARTLVVGQAFTVAAKRGIPSIIAEDGEAGMHQREASDRLLFGLENVLRHLAMLPGGARPVPPARHFAKIAAFFAPQAGFFKASGKLGDALSEGQTLGRLTDFFGATIAEVIAPSTGKLLYLIVNPAIAKGGILGGIGVDRA